ncbi:MAG: hypothetical protein OCC45_05970 [Desulfotalea sp.]
MKIFIGITQTPEEIRAHFSPQSGEAASLTELGPFVSKEEALNWMMYLKSKIRDIEEVIMEGQPLKDGVWHGFTFEKEATN